MTPLSNKALQTPQDCYWSQPGHRLSGLSESEQPESVWVCVREGHRRNVDDHDCATCAYWQQDTTAEGVAGSVSLTASNDTPVARFSVGRAVLVGVAAAALGSVFAIFGDPAPIGFKVVGWLFAGAIIAVSRYGQSDHAR